MYVVQRGEDVLVMAKVEKVEVMPGGRGIHVTFTLNPALSPEYQHSSHCWATQVLPASARVPAGRLAMSKMVRLVVEMDELQANSDRYGPACLSPEAKETLRAVRVAAKEA